MTTEEALRHPWWGNPCPVCSAAAGEPCDRAPKFEAIHGQRSAFAAPARRPEPGQIDLFRATMPCAHGTPHADLDPPPDGAL